MTRQKQHATDRTSLPAVKSGGPYIPTGIATHTAEALPGSRPASLMVRKA